MCWCHLLIKSIKDIESFAIHTTIQIMLPMLLKLLIFTFVKQVWNSDRVVLIWTVQVSLHARLPVVLVPVRLAPVLTQSQTQFKSSSMNLRSFELAKWSRSLCNAFCCGYSWLWTYRNNEYFSSTDTIKLRHVYWSYIF